MLAALDVLEFYADNGSWPVALPSSYIDPFDGEALRYSRTIDGFRIWSIGPDRVDHLGVTYAENEDDYDLAVVYPPVAKPYESQYDKFLARAKEFDELPVTDLPASVGQDSSRPTLTEYVFED